MPVSEGDYSKDGIFNDFFVFLKYIDDAKMTEHEYLLTKFWSIVNMKVFYNFFEFLTKNSSMEKEEKIEKIKEIYS